MTLPARIRSGAAGVRRIFERRIFERRIFERRTFERRTFERRTFERQFLGRKSWAANAREPAENSCHDVGQFVGDRIIGYPCRTSAGVGCMALVDGPIV
jgi:hypothetical protein